MNQKFKECPSFLSPGEKCRSNWRPLVLIAKMWKDKDIMESIGKDRYSGYGSKRIIANA